MDSNNVDDFAMAGVVVTPGFVGNKSKREITFSVPKANVQSLELRIGFGAERPILQVAFGIILCAAGIYPLAILAQWILFGGTLLVNVFFVIWMLPIGVWLMGPG